MTRSSEAPPCRVIFFQVKDPSAKFKWIFEMAQLHFEKKEPFLFFVEDEKAEAFVDELLWKQPACGFLPHVISDTQSQELICITKTKTNVNQAKAAFNLCPTPLLVEGPFRILYEFEDLTSPNKNKFSSIRFNAYKSARLPIESRH